MSDPKEPHTATLSWSGQRETAARAVDGAPALLRLHGPTAPSGEWTVFGLDQRLTQAGRHPVGGGIRLEEDARASRIHAAFERRADDGVVLKNDSRNGSWVNRERVDGERALRDGDVVRMGDSTFLFRASFTAPSPVDEADDVLVGLSPPVCRLRAELATLAPSEARVLILGETGTGKEVVARALHRASGRAGAFTPVNCSAVQTSLAESTFFGHNKGAFTGATSAQPGAFQAADGGTLFLDELGDLPTEIQPKLLRALDDGLVQPLGATRPTAVDVRVLSATNRDLEQDMARGGFRSDLFARLSDVTLRLPPLRDRREDVLLLLAHGLGGARALSPDLAEALLLHRYPRNVRELMKIAKELSIRATTGEILSLPLVEHRLAALQDDDDDDTSNSGDRPAASAGDDRAQAPAVPDRDELIAMLREARGVVSELSRVTGRSRRQVRRWLENHGLDAAEYRDG